jgi:hypothetical protein
MLTTMLLLISVLIFSSVMLLRYASEKQSQSGNAHVSFFDFKRMVEQGRGWSEKVESIQSGDAAGSTEEDAQDSAVKRFFSGSSDGSVRWPKLKLTGFGKSSDAEGAFAIINGRHVLVNTYLDEVKLIEVRAYGAVVEYQGERKYLTVEND